MRMIIIVEMSCVPGPILPDMVKDPIFVAFGLTLGMMTVTFTEGPRMCLRSATIGMMATARSTRMMERSDSYTVVRTPGPPRVSLVTRASSLASILVSLMSPGLVRVVFTREEIRPSPITLGAPIPLAPLRRSTRTSTPTAPVAAAAALEKHPAVVLIHLAASDEGGSRPRTDLAALELTYLMPTLRKLLPVQSGWTTRPGCTSRTSAT